MADLTNSQLLDFKRYYVEDPVGFNPDRNKKVVEQSIVDYELKRKYQSDKYTEQIKERVDAAVSYILHSDQKSTPLEKYFGRKYLAHLQGQRIVQKLKRLQNGKRVITLEEI